MCDYVGKLSTGTTLIYRTILRRSYLKNLVDPDAPLQSLATFARAYHAVLPLTELEQSLFVPLTAARMLTTLAIASARAARYPDNAPYILRNVPSASAGLRALVGLNLSSLWG